MRQAFLGLLVLALASGCHGRFRRAAHDIGDVRPQVIGAEHPTVALGGTPGDLGMVVDVVRGYQAVDVERKLERSVDVDQMNAAFELGLADGLDGGPPFGITDRKKAPLLQVEVLRYGMEVPYLGAQGVFSYDLKVRLYDREGRRVYKTRLSCESPVGDPSALSVALGAVNNAKQIDQMRRKEIQAAFDEAARACGEDLVAKMRKHASPGLGSDLRAALADADKAWDRVDRGWDEAESR